jgi:glycine cleavage system H protein
MSILLGLIAALVFIGLELIRQKRKPIMSPSVIVKRYVHPGHSWMRMTDDGDALVGIDDFAQSLIGSIDAVELPRLLHRIEQGTIGWRLTHGKRTVPMLSPVSGRVIEKNEMILHNPQLINASPYGDGWLLRIRPAKLKSQMNNLFTGKASHQWLDQAKEQLVRFFSATPALMYQDGGLIVKDLSDRISDEEWNVLAEEIFLVNDKSAIKQKSSFFQAKSTEQTKGDR